MPLIFGRLTCYHLYYNALYAPSCGNAICERPQQKKAAQLQLARRTQRATFTRPRVPYQYPLLTHLYTSSELTQTLSSSLTSSRRNSIYENKLLHTHFLTTIKNGGNCCFGAELSMRLAAAAPCAHCHPSRASS